MDRKTLYELVWAVPAMQLALKYGISDVGLAKVCRRHQIPLPPRGYWARVRSGQRIRRPALPKVDERLNEVHISGANMPIGRDEIQSTDRERRERIEIASSLSSPHPLIQAAHEQLESAKPGPDKLVRTDPATAADVHVRPDTVDRALRAFDALAKTWEQEGGRFALGTFRDNPCTVMALGDDAVAIRMIETTEPIRAGRRRADISAPPASPRLGLTVAGGQAEGLKGLWADTNTIRLERMLRPLIDAMRRYLEAQRQVRLDRECEQRQQERARAVEQAKADEASEEFYLRQQIVEDANRWCQAEKIRSYLVAIEQQIESGRIKPTRPDRFQEWMEWAKWFADDMDPMVQAPPRVRESTVPKNTPVTELDLTSRARSLISRLGVKNSDELLLVPESKVRELAGWNPGLWAELTRVLEGLGYDVAKRKSRYY